MTATTTGRAGTFLTEMVMEAPAGAVLTSTQEWQTYLDWYTD